MSVRASASVPASIRGEHLGESYAVARSLTRRQVGFHLSAVNELGTAESASTSISNESHRRAAAMGFTSLHFYLGSLAERAAHGECELANAIRGLVLLQTGASATRPSETRRRTANRTPARPPVAAAGWAAGRGISVSTPISTAAAAAAGERAMRGRLAPPPAAREWGKSPIRPLSCRPQVTIGPARVGWPQSLCIKAVHC